MPCSWNEADIPRIVSETRLAQGLPERVEDPATLATVAALLRTAREHRYLTLDPSEVKAAGAERPGQPSA